LLDRLHEHLYQPEQMYNAAGARLRDLGQPGHQHGRPFVVAQGPARTLRKVHAPRAELLQVGSIAYDRAS
jgi:taurine dioxygenase